MSKYKVTMEFEIDDNQHQRDHRITVKPDKQEFSIDVVNNEDYIVSLENMTPDYPPRDKKCGIIFWKFGAGFVHTPMKLIKMEEIK